MTVHLDRPPRSAQLVAWGRALDGWWACVTFRQRVKATANGEVDELAAAAWVPARSVSAPAWVGRVDVPRIQLGDRQSWPAPPGWPSWYAGIWIDGAMAIPTGVEIVTGPAWRETRRRN